MNNLYLKVFDNMEGVSGFFSTKAGASSESPYNNPQVIKELGAENLQLIWPKQIHSDQIVVIKERRHRPLILDDTDGMITNLPGVLLTTVHADCLAIYLYDPVGHAIGLVHAGWRGTLMGIGRKAALMMKEQYGSSLEDIKIYIGPGISPCCFETGPEVYEAFQEKWNFIDAYAEPKGAKYFIDLKGINKQQLTDIGVRQIEVSSHCTCCEPELFRSYRREGGMKARLGAGLWLTDKK